MKISTNQVLHQQTCARSESIAETCELNVDATAFREPSRSMHEPACYVLSILKKEENETASAPIPKLALVLDVLTPDVCK